jgi:hypothetical protein
MQTTIKASNAIAALVDYYQAITAEHINQLKSKDDLIVRLTEQLRVFSAREEKELAVISAAVDLIDASQEDWVNRSSALFTDLSDAVTRYKEGSDG